MPNFLGPRGKATIVLMKAHVDSDLPKLKDLKKILNISDARFYKSKGINSNSIRMLENLLNILQSSKNQTHISNLIRSTDYLVTVDNISSNTFMLLKYSSNIVGGFSLTDSAMNQLKERLSEFFEINSMKSRVECMAKELIFHKESAIKFGFTDQTLLNPDLAAFQAIMIGYGDQQHAQAVKNLESWHQAYRW